MKTVRNLLSALIPVAAVALTSSAAHATVRTFDLAWSGDFFANGASATGTLIMDDAAYPNGGFGRVDSIANWGVQSLTITVTGASVGNGTFTQNDFSTMYWIGDYANFDFSSELVGQQTDDSPFATFGQFSGDFDFAAINPQAPNAAFGSFTLGTAGGTGDLMYLTHLGPAGGAAAPEPGSIALLLMGAPAVGMIVRRKIAR